MLSYQKIENWIVQNNEMKMSCIKYASESIILINLINASSVQVCIKEFFCM